MLTVTNQSGYLFVWPNYSEYVEVYHGKATHADIPVDAILAADLPRSTAALRRLANESPEYSRPYA